MPEIFTHRCPNIAPRIWVHPRSDFPPTFFFPAFVICSHLPMQMMPVVSKDEIVKTWIQRWQVKERRGPYKPIAISGVTWSPRKNDPNKRANNALVVINGVITSINGPINGHKPCKSSYHPTSYRMWGRTLLFQRPVLGCFCLLLWRWAAKLAWEATGVFV